MHRRSIPGLVVAFASLVPMGCVTEQHRDQVRQAARIYFPLDNSLQPALGHNLVKIHAQPGNPAFPSADASLAPPGVHGRALALSGRAIDIPLQGPFTKPDAKGGWSGAACWWLWLNAQQATPCRPFQLVASQASEKGLWLELAPTPKNLQFSLRAGTSGEHPAGSSLPAQKSVLEAPRASLSPATWHHFALVWANLDHPTANAWLAVYVDGKLAGTIKQQRLPVHWDWPSTLIRLGEGCHGALDELAIFERPLSVSEIRLLRDEPGLLAAR